MNEEEDEKEGGSVQGTQAAYMPAKRGVNAFQLTMMIYFFTCGGPFGIESAVASAGPLLTLVALTLVPLLWSLPQALLSAELALLLPENGGNVVWVQAAFGDFIGFVNAYNTVAQSIASLALLAVLFVDYIPLTLSWVENWGIKIAFIIVNTIFNLIGIKWMSRISLLLLIFVLSPFVTEIMLVIAQGKLNIHALRVIPPVDDIQWGVFLSTVIWCYGGFDNMGALAGEVKGGRATFMAGILGSFPLIFLNYFFPIFVGFSLDTNYKDWQSGYFTPLAYSAAKWLGVWMVIASAVSNYGQFNAGFAPVARMIWAMAKSPGTSRKMPGILAWTHISKDGTATPVAAILFTSLSIVFVTGLPFGILVEIFLMIRIFNLIFEYLSLIRLRYTRPNDHRPFAVPGGMVGVWILGLPTVGLAGFALSQANWVVWASGAVVNAFAVVVYLCKWFWEKKCPSEPQYSPVNI